MKLFTDIARELSAYEDRRDKVIRVSRDHLREAKRIIFLCHEGKINEANSRLKTLTGALKKDGQIFSKSLKGSKDRFMVTHEGSWAAALEEYAESFFLVNVLLKKKLVEPVIRIPGDILIGGLADMTGELARLSVMSGAARDLKAVAAYKKIVAEVIAFMVPLYVTGSNRQKVDQAKKNLKRIEEIVYEVTIRQ